MASISFTREMKRGGRKAALPFPSLLPHLPPKQVSCRSLQLSPAGRPKQVSTRRLLFAAAAAFHTDRHGLNQSLSPKSFLLLLLFLIVRSLPLSTGIVTFKPKSKALQGDFLYPKTSKWITPRKETDNRLFDLTKYFCSVWHYKNPCLIFWVTRVNVDTDIYLFLYNIYTFLNRWLYTQALSSHQSQLHSRTQSSWATRQTKIKMALALIVCPSPDA